jgi:hypothetical protein
MATILALAAAYDLRTVGEADVEAWHAAVGDLDFESCRKVVIEHYRNKRERLMPADLRWAGGQPGAIDWQG